MTFKAFVKSSKQDAGFSLFEICVTLIISGMVLVMVTNAIKQYTKSQKYETSKENLILAKDIVESYYAIYGYYPCPADPTLDPTDANYGIAQCRDFANTSAEPDNCDSEVGDIVCTHIGTYDRDSDGDADNILIGAIPFYTLIESVPDPRYTTSNFNEANKKDGFGNLLSYTVSEQMTNTYSEYDYVTPAPTYYGAITVIDEFGISLTRDNEGAHFLVFSHGDDQLGAYTQEGELVESCFISTGTPPNPGGTPSGAGTYFQLNELISTAQRSPLGIFNLLNAYAPRFSKLNTPQFFYTGGGWPGGGGNNGGGGDDGGNNDGGDGGGENGGDEGGDEGGGGWTIDPTPLDLTPIVGVDLSASSIDIAKENCDNNDGIFMKAARSMQDNNSYFDDTVYFISERHTTLWLHSNSAGGGETYLYNSNLNGNVGIGTEEPSYALHVVGNTKVEGKASSAAFCDSNDGTICLNPGIFAGDLEDMECTDPKQVAYAIHNNKIECRDVEWQSVNNLSCPSTSSGEARYVVGISNIGRIYCCNRYEDSSYKNCGTWDGSTWEDE